MPPSLESRIPEKGFASVDAMLDAFLAWVADQGLSLYAHQQDAILEIFGGNHVVLDAPTGSGKSLVAVALHFKTFAQLGRSWYTAPVKALVSQKFFELCEIFGAEHVGMLTGDAAVNRDAPIICCTAEILANVALREGENANATSVVMDEFHYYGDRDRGMAWQIPLLTLPKTTFLLMSGTLGDTLSIREDLEKRTGRAVAEVLGVVRPVPLSFTYSMTSLHETIPNLVQGGQAPVYVVHFTQRAATEQAQALMSVDHCTKDEKKAIQEALRGFSFQSPFGPTMRRYVAHGVGLHHAGLLPRYRLLVERLAQQGLLKIICGTDTLGVGINVPIRTVLFTQLCKFDGEKVIILPIRDFKQIAGRAGRAGFDTQGYVVVQAPAHTIENARILVTDPKRRKKAVKAQPPTKGYKHWDETTFQQLVERPPEPLVGSFVVDHGRMLSLMQHAQENGDDARVGFERMLDLVERAQVSEKEREGLKAEAQVILDSLAQAGVVTHDLDGRLVLDETLQHDFSLHHSLSLFLLDALGKLDQASETYALDVVTWVEAILEHPRAVLFRQVDRAKGERIAELKAEGVPYEERMEALEEVSHPKPHADLIYATYNTYVETHPWVSHAPIRPKSVVREMIERYASFSEYVRDLQLQRMEGVLLRYLSDAYKVLVQNVPADAHTDALLDVVAYLRAMLAHVDSSLVTEWEAMLAGAGATEETVIKVDISADPRRFAARVRAELHSLVRALARQDWEEAAGCVRRDEDDPYGPEDWQAAFAPFVEAHGKVGFDHRARLTEHTTLTKVGLYQWEVRQRILPPMRIETERYRGIDVGEEDEGDDPDKGTWSIDGLVDLRDDTNPEGPLIRIVRIDHEG